MSTIPDRTVTVDDKGIWIQDEGKPPFGYEWDEIFKIGGYLNEQFDEEDTEEVYTVIFDTEYGEYLEILSDLDGFADVVERVPRHLPNVSEDWFERIRKSSDEIARIWQRESDGS